MVLNFPSHKRTNSSTSDRNVSNKDILLWDTRGRRDVFLGRIPQMQPCHLTRTDTLTWYFVSCEIFISRQRYLFASCFGGLVDINLYICICVCIEVAVVVFVILYKTAVPFRMYASEPLKTSRKLCVAV